MSNPWQDLENALQETKRFQNAVDNRSNTLADMLQGRLRQVTPHKLKKLKKELSQFNARTGRWSS